MRRILLSPSWWLRHALMIVLVGLFLRLGWWQFTKGESGRGTLQNLFYGIEWPFFAGCVVFGWWRMMVDEVRGPSEPAAPPAGTPGADDPTTPVESAGDRAAAVSTRYAPGADDDEEDEELAEYNRYLAALAAHHEAKGSR